MPQLNGLGLENFRVFKEKHWFDFAPITILTGTNSSGKSSLINAIEILANAALEEEDAVAKLSRTIGNKNFPVLKDFSFQGTTFYSRKLAKRLGDFSTMQNDPNLGVNVFFSSFSRLLGISLEITLQYKTADTFVNSGKLTLLNISTLDKTETILNVEVLDEKIELSINYQYFFENFLRLFKDKTEEQRFENLNHSIGDTRRFHIDDFYYGFNEGELNKVIDKGIDYFINGSETMFEYEMKSNHYYNEKTEEMIAEGEKEDFEKELMKYTQKYKHEIQKHKSLKHFLSYYEKIYLKNFKANLPNTEINYNTLISVLEIIVNPISDNPRYDGIDIDEENPILQYIIMPFSSIEARKDKHEFSNWFLNNFIGEIIIDVLSDAKIPKPIFLPANRVDIKRSFNDSETLDNVSTFSNQVYRIQNLKINEYRKKAGIDPFSFINYSLQHLNIGDEIEFKRNSDNSSVLIYIKKGEKKKLLADVGYGVSQVLSVILEIALKIASITILDSFPSEWTIDDFYFKDKYGQGIIIIEEPEANLHPANQSKLADIIVRATKTFGIQFIIETHSEYLIRKLQVLTADQNCDLTPKDTQIYYFYHPDDVPEGAKQVYPINIEADGTLTKNFGKGFFDESSNLNIALYQFTKNNKN